MWPKDGRTWKDIFSLRLLDVNFREKKQSGNEFEKKEPQRVESVGIPHCESSLDVTIEK